MAGITYIRLNFPAVDHHGRVAFLFPIIMGSFYSWPNWNANAQMSPEETAAMRSQANTAKMLDGNPTLMRLRELEVLEKVASAGRLNVMLGEKGLADKVVNLL
jgi:hypothetical protein